MNETVVVAAIVSSSPCSSCGRCCVCGHQSLSRRRGVTVAQPAWSISSELAELELDRAMGRVSEADFVKWRGEIEAGVTVEEGSPAAAADAKPTDATARAEALVRRWSTAARPSCPDCGVRPEPEARYCSNCGASLTT
jgi:hypothetical protein